MLFGTSEPRSLAARRRAELRPIWEKLEDRLLLVAPPLVDLGVDFREMIGHSLHIRFGLC